MRSVEPVYHNVIFLMVAIFTISRAVDLLEPRWKLRRRQPKRLKDKLREAKRNDDTETREWFGKHEIRDVRKRGASGFVIGLVLVFCLQPSVGWVARDWKCWPKRRLT
jgi:hypothetical protein